ncbi:hypothetical protein KQH82_05585 [bacterium]|nr:hypothetical protein [bacterium]
MKRLFVSGAVAALVVVLVSGMLVADEQAITAPLEQLMPEQYQSSGLYKLEASEQEQLIQSFATAPVPSFTAKSAERYLEKEGWRPIRVVGAVVVNTITSERHLLAVHDYKFVTLDPIGEPYLLEPGRYWAKTTGSSWTVLYPDGSAVTHWMRERR